MSDPNFFEWMKEQENINLEVAQWMKEHDQGAEPAERDGEPDTSIVEMYTNYSCLRLSVWERVRLLFTGNVWHLSHPRGERHRHRDALEQIRDHGGCEGSYCCTCECSREQSDIATEALEVEP